MDEKPNKFIVVLYEILENNSDNDCICWSNGGNAFIIPNIKEFSQNILKENFQTSKIQSFLRQLSLYGFNMRKNNQNQKEYYHSLFFKGNYSQIYLIRRKRKRQEKQEYHDQLILLQQENNLISKELSEIKFKQDQILHQLRNSFQIQFFMAKSLNRIIDRFKNRYEKYKIYRPFQKLKFLFLSVLLGYKPEIQIQYIDYILQNDLQDLLTPSPQNFSPILFHNIK